MTKREANEAAVKELLELIENKKRIERKRYELHQAWIAEFDDAKAVKIFKQYKKLGKELRKAEDAIDEFVESF